MQQLKRYFKNHALTRTEADIGNLVTEYAHVLYLYKIMNFANTTQSGGKKVSSRRPLVTTSPNDIAAGKGGRWLRWRGTN